MNNLKLFGFNIWNNNNNIISGKTNINYGLGKMRNTVASTSRIYKHCSNYYSDPLNCTLGFVINNSNMLPSTLPSTLLSPPNPPIILNVIPGNEEANIYFTPGSSSGSSISDYLYSLNEITYVSSGSISSPIKISGLTNGVTYNITLKAVNSDGISIASSSVSVTLIDPIPLSPVLTGVTFKTTNIMTITFTQVSNGIHITNYKYSIDGGKNYITFAPLDATSPVTISGLLSNTTYDICLKAISAVGESSSSNIITETTYANVNYATFTDIGSSTWTAPAGVTFVQYLVVGGGGGGGATYSNILDLGAVPFVSSLPSSTPYWINSTQGSFYGYFYKGTSTHTLNRVARISCSQDITPNGSSYLYNRWYSGEIVYYMNSEFPLITNYESSNTVNVTSNNVSGGSGGGSGGQTKFLSGTTKYDVTPGNTYVIIVGAGGNGGIGGADTETNGNPGGDSSFDTIVSFGGSGGSYSRNMSLNQDTNKNGKGGNGGEGYGNLFGGSGGGNNSSNNYGKYNSGGLGFLGLYTTFDGTGKNYGAGGNGGVPNTVATGTTLANIGKGGSGTGATLNSFANGIDGGSGIVIIKYYT